MALTYGFYNSMNGDRRYNSRHMSKLFNGIIKDGIFMSIGTSMVVTATDSMVVNVGIGRAWFNGTWTDNDSVMELRLTASDLLMDRIDAVVLEVDTNDNVRTNSIKVITGEPSTVPNQPTMIRESGRYQYPLAYIYVAGTVETITQANITNMVGTSETPFVTGVLETMNTDALIAQWKQEWVEWVASKEAEYVNWTTEEKAEYDQWVVEQEAAMNVWLAGLETFKTTNEADFVAWFESIKGQLSEDAAGNLQNQVNEIVEREFNRYYGLVNKVVEINKGADGNLINIVETTDEMVSTTTFETTDTGKVITTACVPVEGNYDYTKTVTIEQLDTGTRISESYIQTAKEA